MIEARELSYAPAGSGRRLIDTLTLRVPPGRATGLIGPNGAGKSTLLRILAGVLRPTGGTASVAGYDVARSPRAVRARTGLLTPSHGVPESATPAWHLRLHGALRSGHGRGHAVDKDQIGALMKCLGLDRVARQRAGSLSTGYLRRLALARALLHDPQVLLLDEPTAGLDTRTVATLHGIVRALTTRGRTLLIATHDQTFLRDHCDPCFEMSDGRIL